MRMPLRAPVSSLELGRWIAVVWMSSTLSCTLSCSPQQAGSPQGDGPRGDGQHGDELPRDLWVDVTETVLPTTAEWSHRVEAADLDLDGDLDLIFVNGGNYSTPGEPELNRVFLNPGGGSRFEEATREILGEQPDLARAIKVRDVTDDGLPDIVVACAYGTPSRLFIGTEPGGFQEVTDSHFPQPGTVDGSGFSFGDVEAGDVDDDGDLDLVLADWGPGDAMSNPGARPRLWLNQLVETGSPTFLDATDDRLPDDAVAFPWDLELYDTDNDFDLDVVVSCKRCGGGLLLRNDGTGHFTSDRRALPQYTNNYDYAGMDLDGDGYLDLVTVNDGDIANGDPYSRREHVLINTGLDDSGRQGFADRTDQLWPDDANVGEDDNAVAFLDYDSDGDVDFLLASLTGADRLLINDGAGGLSLASQVLTGSETPGTLGIALADLDGDHRLDIAMSQGEHETATDERVFLGRGLEPDAAAPVLGEPRIETRSGASRVRLRIHDAKSPVQIEDFTSVTLERTPDADREGAGSADDLALSWYGGQLWRTAWLPLELDGSQITVCAVDRAGNRSCRDLSP